MKTSLYILLNMEHVKKLIFKKQKHSSFQRKKTKNLPPSLRQVSQNRWLLTNPRTSITPKLTLTCPRKIKIDSNLSPKNKNNFIIFIKNGLNNNFIEEIFLLMFFFLKRKKLKIEKGIYDSCAAQGCNSSLTSYI